MITITLTHALQQLYSQETQACHLAFIPLSTQCIKVQLVGRPYELNDGALYQD